MAKYGSDYCFWEDDLNLDELLGEYTEDEITTVSIRIKDMATYICPECNKECKSISGFRGHVLKKHDKNLKGEKIRIFLHCH